MERVETFYQTLSLKTYCYLLLKKDFFEEIIKNTVFNHKSD